VNATLIARERGIAIDERHVREDAGGVPTYASLVTLRSLDSHQGGTSSNNGSGEQVIEGYVSGKAIFISKLDRFAANFHPEGTLLILHNYDTPGKIGNVGLVLGRHGINITFMEVAGLNREARLAAAEIAIDGPVEEGQEEEEEEEEGSGRKGNGYAEKEALMILGVDGDVTKDVVDDLGKAEGILNVSLIRL
jgi:D-3-phosphoglycerate dehydrogenase / 2-oxoglutarate reductase